MIEFAVGRWSCKVVSRVNMEAPEDDWDFRLTAKLNHYSDMGIDPLGRFRRSLGVEETQHTVGGIYLRCDIYVASNGGFRWVAEGKAGSVRKSPTAVAVAEDCVGFWEANLQIAEQEAKALRDAENEFQQMNNGRYEPNPNR